MTYGTERNAMVTQQLASRDITDERVLEAFRKVARHEFVPKELLNEAYADYPLPIGEGQTISQPYIVALMTQCLRLKGDEKVLEVGTGSGYQTAIMAELAKEVYSIERFGTLSENARQVLNRLGYKNIKLQIGDGTLGWEQYAPYGGILVTAGAPALPDSLVKQLSENGRLVIPLGGTFSQVLTVVEKKNGKLISTEVCGCVFVPLIGSQGWKGSQKN